MTNSITNNPSNILSSWIALEVLSPQTFRYEEELAGTSGSIAKFGQGLLPWEGNGEGSKPNYRLFYQVVLGTIDFGKSISELSKIYADKRVDPPAAKGEAVLAVVVLDNKGRPTGSPAIAVSSFAWGMPQALKGDLKRLASWAESEETLTTTLDKMVRRTDKDGLELPLDKSTMNKMRDHLIRTLELPVELMTGNSFAIRTYEYMKNPEPPDPILLNSFYIGDLITTKRLFADGKTTRNLQLYLGAKSPPYRKELLHNRQELEKTIAPSLMSPSRWPGPGRHPLVLLQQAAVNLALRELKENGILAVNGPPGTGKTTLLRDLVAGIVADRAEALCTFDNPADAFTHSGEKIKAGQGWLYLYKLNDRVKGYEILIASSNNKAVENVSAELPAIKAISDEAGELRYFTCLSDELLERESWGLIAAVLGNATNRARFRQVFWWDKEVGMSTYLAEAAGTPQMVEVRDSITGKLLEERPPRIVTAEQAPHSHEEALKLWKNVKARFMTTLNQSRSQLSLLEKTRGKVLLLPELEKAKIVAESLLSSSELATAKAQLEWDAAKALYLEKEQKLKEAEQAKSEHFKLRPDFFARLFRTSKARAWKKEHTEHVSNTNKSAQPYHDSSQALANCDATLNKNKEATKEYKDKYKKASEHLENVKHEVENDRKRLGSHFIDDQFFEKPHGDRHLASPWCTKEMQILRDNVFTAAMQLHKAFIGAAAKPLRHNLGVLMMTMGGKELADEEKMKLLPDLWSSLFLTVPCLSTTFASVERMLGNLPAESLGWLLIDEAGQALPQAAIGAIMRTKRAAVVGDPMQIEPIVILPGSLTQGICRNFGVDPDRFNAPEASAQTLADSATPYFAEFEGKSGSRSVGVPLLVHRRCEDPMFGISNVIAYERLMVQAKKPGISRIRDLLGPSRWIDIQGQAKEKWCPEEGEIVLDLLRRLRAANISPDLYIVTPFTIVASSLRELIKNSGVLRSWIDEADKWPYERIGTVHTVQGREAEAVIFVLGAPVTGQFGARGWAGKTPNLLNVAVTRAKEVLYVVGNRELWKAAGPFRELSDRMPQ